LHIDSAANGQLYLNHYSDENIYMVTGGGNVGIGTTSPGVLLDITGAHTSGQGMMRLNGTTHAFATYNAGTGSNSGFFFNEGSGTR